MKIRILFVIACMVMVGGSGYVFSRFSQTPNAQFGAVSASMRLSTSSPVDSGRDVPRGMKEFRSEMYRFSLLHPESMKVQITDEGQGASTITFEDTQMHTGFQLFIVPYLDARVSEERFRMDIPSGIRRNMKDVAIDGAAGASFESVHDLLGETAEVWFVSNGYLYEATTLKSLEEVLSQVLSTWQFISTTP